METGSHNALVPTLSEGGEHSAPRLPFDLWRHGGGRARPRVAWGARARSTLLAALIFFCFFFSFSRRGVSPALRLWTFGLEQIMGICVCCWPRKDNHTSAQIAAQTGMELGSVKGPG